MSPLQLPLVFFQAFRSILPQNLVLCRLVDASAIQYTTIKQKCEFLLYVLVLQIHHFIMKVYDERIHQIIRILWTGNWTWQLFQYKSTLFTYFLFLHCTCSATRTFISAFRPSHVSKSLISLIGNATSGSVWVIENGEEAYELEFPERLGTKKQ